MPPMHGLPNIRAISAQEGLLPASCVSSAPAALCASAAIAGILGALLMDQMTVNSFDTDNYRYGYLFRFAANCLSFF